MTIFFAAIIMACIAGAISIIWGRRFEEALPMSVLCLVVVLYIFGMAGNLKLGFYACCFLGGIGIGICAAFLSFSAIAWKKIRAIRKASENPDAEYSATIRLKNGKALTIEPKKIFETLITPGAIAFFIIVVFFWWNERGRLLQQWDDFSHWGLVVKNMHIFQKLGNVAESTCKFKDYPPGASLMAYFFSSFGAYSETNAICGLGIMTVSFMMPLFRYVKWEKKIVKTVVAGVFMTALVYLVPTMFHPNAYVGLYVDSLLGVIFAFLVFVLLGYEQGVFRWMNLFAGCFIITLTKASGAGLAGIAILFLVAGLFLAGAYKEGIVSAADPAPAPTEEEPLDPKIQEIVDRIKAASEKKAKKQKLINLRNLFLDIVSGVAGLLLANKSWSLYLTACGTERGWSASELSLQGIIDLFTGNAPEYRMITVQKYAKFFMKQRMGGIYYPISLFTWTILFVALAVLFIYLCRKEDRKRYTAIFTGLILGYIVYVVFLLVLYLFSYSQYEAMRLASSERYVATYLIGMVGAYAFLFLHYFRERILGISAAVLVAVILCATQNGIKDTILYPQESILTSQKVSEGYYGANRFADKLDYTNDRVYVISQNNAGEDYWHLRNVLTPVKINDNYTWSIGESYGPEDFFTSYKNPVSWSDDLRLFTRVYLFRVDQQFTDQFGEMFDNPADIGNDRMYDIYFEDGSETAILVLNEEMTSY